MRLFKRLFYLAHENDPGYT